ncbi:MAG: hypothetical protein LBU13_10860 [Synergistaceae bacterium]|jgi:uncharacterized protein involved in exopolysaccharide biosynthesis|nr:hypothetical protein [Synergistaceae bacterium]
MQEEKTLYEILLLFIRKKKLIAIFVFLFGCGAVFNCLVTPKIYKAEVRIMPPVQGKTGMASAMLSQLGAGAGLIGLSGMATNGQLLIGVLKGNTVVDKIIDRFDLMSLYGKEYRVKMREQVISSLLNLTEDTKSGIVTIGVLDKDPVRAAEMANAFVEELKSALQLLALGEAAQRRIFFEQQLVQSHKNLNDAEDELQRYQEQSGLVVMEPQFQAMLASIEALRAQVAAKEVEISSLKTYARVENPNLKRAMSELSALRAELNKLEQQQTLKTEDKTPQTASLREAPQLGLEYQRRVRNVKFASAMYEIMMQQFEAAKVDESREAMVVQVIDPASPPDYKYKPKRSQIVLLGLLVGLGFGMTWVLIADYIQTMRKDFKQRSVREYELS